MSTYIACLPACLPDLNRACLHQSKVPQARSTWRWVMSQAQDGVYSIAAAAAAVSLSMYQKKKKSRRENLLVLFPSEIFVIFSGVFFF